MSGGFYRENLLIFIIACYMLPTVIFAKQTSVLVAQPEILFEYKKIKRGHKKLSLQIDFNKAVLLLEKEHYQEAIEIFKKTAKILKIPSFLNIGIAYYKLKSNKNAILYLTKIYEYQEAKYDNAYSYMSACYYLFQLTNNDSYLETIIKVAKKHKKLSEDAKRLVADTYIMLKEYEKAIKILDSMNFALDLKKALLYLKLKNYTEAEIYLNKTLDETVNKKMYDKILWIMIYRDLKENSIEKLKEHIELLQHRKRTFGAHFELPLKIYFNKRKFTSKQYLDMVTKFDENRKIDFIFYFAPFVFSDNQEIFYDSSKGFIFKNKQNLKSLEDMIEYNAKFIELIKQDPIVRVDKLTKLLNKDTKSYIYYNLGLSCAQINDFHHAYQYFKKAYKLNPGNKVFAAMTLICAKRVRIKVRDKAYIEENILSKDGLYSYFGQSLYKMIINPKSKIKIKKDVQKYEKTIFYKAMRFLTNIEEKGIVKDDPLLVDHYKDPLVYLIKLVAKDKNRSNYQYISRMQDEVPLKLNNNFLEGPLIVTQYYIDILKALGLFSKADLDIPNSKSPSYLRTKAFRDLHAGNPESTISILEYLQDKYKLEDKYTLYLMVASLLEAKRENDASVTISLIKALLNDDGADFLTGVQLLQELKFTSALQYFNYPYKDSLIDFKLVGLDKFLESL